MAGRRVLPTMHERESDPHVAELKLEAERE